jgi:hypothetical protein
MTAISITPGYPTFADTDGSPLNDGYVYIGLEYQDPITAPTTAFWDKEFRIPADQPLRTSGGYVVRDGSPAAVYTGAAYSILVQNKNLVTVYNAPSAVITNVTNDVEIITQYQGAHATDPVARNDGTPLQTGDLYFNTVVNELKVWTGTVWVPAVPGTVTVENFTGTGAQTAFNLATAPVAENNTQIYIDGVYQQKDTYTLSGATINFSAAPPLNSTIEVVTFSIASLGTVDASNVSYNEGSLGAVNTSVQAKLQESVSVADFGAVGDGSTDCSAAITAALAAVPAYGTLVFPAGTYIIDSPIVIPSSNITIDGQGARLLAKPSVSFEYMLSATSKSGVVIKNIEADANQLNRVSVQGVRFMAMAFTSCDDCTFENCIARNVLGYSSIPGVGLTIGGTSIRCQIVNCRLINCGSATQGADGVFMSGEANMVIGSTAINCFDTGFAIESSNASGIVGCITRSCGAAAAITNAVNDDKYANFIDGLSAFDTTGGGGVTGLIQIGCPLSTSLGNLYDTSISNVILSNPTGGTGVGPAINIRQTGTTEIPPNYASAVRVSIDSVRVFNATPPAPPLPVPTQGILIDGDNVSIRNSDIYGVTDANFQFTDGSTGGYVSNCTTNGGSYGLITQGTASVTVNNCVFTSPTAWGLYAFDTSTLSSYFNQAISPATGPASKAAGATLKLVGGDVGLQLNNASGTAPAGALSDKIEVFDANNVSLGFMAIYAS